jgi:hypothetical protein
MMKKLIMKKLMMMVVLLSLIGACAQEESAAVSSNAVEAVEAVVADDVTELPPATPAAYYEYLYCKDGPNYSPDAFWAMLKDWNGVIDALDAQPTAAFGYSPRGWENENFDKLWVMRWADKAAMEAGWAAYVANDSQSKVDAMHPGVLSCGAVPSTDRFGWTAYVPRDMPDSFDPTNSPYYLTNEICAFNEGKSADDMRRVIRDQFLPELDVSAAANPDSTYWFRVEAADFVSNPDMKIDTNWVNFWQTAEEGEASAKTFETSEAGKAIRAAFYEVSTCQPIRAWDGWLLRAPAAAAAE